MNMVFLISHNCLVQSFVAKIDTHISQYTLSSFKIASETGLTVIYFHFFFFTILIKFLVGNFYAPHVIKVKLMIIITETQIKIEDMN